MLADENRYVWDFDIYLGMCLPPKFQLLEIAERLKQKGKGFIIVTDSKWGSEEVARKLGAYQ